MITGEGKLQTQFSQTFVICFFWKYSLQ